MRKLDILDEEEIKDLVSSGKMSKVEDVRTSQKTVKKKVPEALTTFQKTILDTVKDVVPKLNEVMNNLTTPVVTIDEPKPKEDKIPKKWKFTVNRGSDKLIKDVIAKEIK